jgi:hypothetical protein
MADLTKALRQLREERSRTQKQLKRLDEAIVVLGKVVSGSGGGQGNGRHGPRKLSVAARRRIAEAQKKRWAKWKLKHVKKIA